MLDGGDVEPRGLGAGQFVHDILDELFVAADRRERHVQFTQVFTDQAARVPGRAVDDDRFLVAHGTTLKIG